MDSSQIEQYLGFLGQKLADMQITTSLILLGGALMITQLGNLTVYVPELEYILALKLFAGRPQDDRDIQAIAQRLSQNQGASLVYREHVHPKLPARFQKCLYKPGNRPLFSALARYLT